MPQSHANQAEVAFNTLPLQAALLQSLQDLGFERTTLVQARTLPRILNGEDVIARARTGSGKTVAFGLGMLQRLDPHSFRVQGLVLCPTRELADQVAAHVRQLARHIGNVKLLTLCGGVGIGPQIGSLKHSAHIIVGTPGRVLKHLRHKSLRLHGLTTLVLDEADRMLDMGFTDEIDAILSHLPSKRQTLLFSATYPAAILQMSERVQQQPTRIDVTDDQAPVQVTQHWLASHRDSRLSDLLRALDTWGGQVNIVFCNTKVDCAEVAAYLISKGISALALHGDLEQADRTLALVCLRNHSATVLVATDVAARGLDIPALDAVVNYELPNQPEVYVHRIGRTGRAAASGVAVSLVAQREQGRLAAIQTLVPDLQAFASEAPLAKATGAAHLHATMQTIEVNGGRKHKLRPGDLLGALTAGGRVTGSDVGRIELLDSVTYVAVSAHCVKTAVAQLSGNIKGRTFKARPARLSAFRPGRAPTGQP